MRNTINGGVFLNTVVQGRDITVQLPPAVPTALGALPSASPAFTGRSRELETLLSLLDPTAQTAAVAVCAVAGLAGVGKTELAIQAARTALSRGWFPGGVLFVNMHGYDNARRVDSSAAILGLLQALGVRNEHIPAESHDRARLYHSVLSTYGEQNRSILLLVDNVRSAEDVRPLLPVDGATRAVVTSRHTLATLDARLLELNVLSQQAAVDNHVGAGQSH
ncbi:AAA family ATPase [Kitasatospora sp. A2-31]|uniref:AAA family ATPase n=1 Tax=Kitasatospora sp. A2-31 TaxID=2916414 RepID=UPI001EEF3496|nr:AAA family ATPase [Kitasatospora sp. A2-31]MCG6499859.1 AAA family ATPase [Kitasatospora sp. A2-31]MCG6499929.1 AAA family ATPase [Kitasatospora sp. A2-31]